MHVTIATPQATLYDDQAVSVYLTTGAGEIGILEGHTELIANTVPGVMTVTALDGREYEFFLGDGVVDVNQNEEVKIFSEDIEVSDTIDTDLAEEARKKAEEELEKLQSSSAADDIEFARIQAELEKQLIRSDIARRRNKNSHL